MSTYFDIIRRITSTSSSIYNINDLTYILERNIILPEMYDLNINKFIEKNWSFVNYKNDLCIIYKWFPLQIGKINYIKNTMNIINIKYNIPEHFKDARGSTSGFIYNDEIWFVLHKTQSYKNNKNTYLNNQHFFAIFDLNMNLIRYSELFTFNNCKVEFCIGLIIKDNEIILSYSLLGTQSIIAVYDLEYINNNIKWYVD
jgi:hypothetical protein